MGFSIVHFPETNEVEIVPEKWIDFGEGVVKCWWPPYKSPQKLESAVKNEEEVEMEVWNIYNVRILKKYGKVNFVFKKMYHYFKNCNIKYVLYLLIFRYI